MCQSVDTCCRELLEPLAHTSNPDGTGAFNDTVRWGHLREGATHLVSIVCDKDVWGVVVEIDNEPSSSRRPLIPGVNLPAGTVLTFNRPLPPRAGPYTFRVRGSCTIGQTPHFTMILRPTPSE